MLSAKSRFQVARVEVFVGALLALSGVALCVWCSWSVPTHGVATPHGLETAACNWGTSMLALLNIGIGVAILVLGLLARWQTAVCWRWSVCQVAISALVGYIVLLFVK
jgi:hypothetical protein